ncbi:MAG: N-acetylmuramoyl-L-alanine amidase, partial [Thermodesulfobacteriota bacterium]
MNNGISGQKILLSSLKTMTRFLIPLVFFLIGFYDPLGGILLPAKAATSDPELEQRYNQARQIFFSLDKSPQKTQRQPWESIIETFKDLYKKHPKTLWGERSMFMAGRGYYVLYQWSGLEADLDLALDHFSRFVNHYPQSNLADDALWLSAEIFLKHRKDPDLAQKKASTLIKTYPKGDMKKRAEDLLTGLEKKDPLPETKSSDPLKETSTPETIKPQVPESFPKKLPQVTGMRHWSTPLYTRIVVDVEDKISYRPKLLKKDPAVEKPERLYLDLFPARLAADTAPLVIQDGLLKGARIGQYDASTVRLVLDIESIKGYKVFFLENPFRLIVDVSGKEKPLEQTVVPPEKEKKLSLAQQLGLGVRRIVIDAGHGGKDTGAIGKTTVYEKNLTLKIAQKLSQRIRQELDLEVIMTRDTDRFIPLEERTAIANTRHADLFLSIHVNASPNTQAEGVETYFLNLATDEESIRVAARENATSTKRISDMQKILKDLMLNTKIDESSRLAGHIQKTLVESLNEKFAPVKNLGVKQAPFYVLIGAQMPSILVETSFISNDRERERLLQEDYLDQIVEGLLR